MAEKATTASEALKKLEQQLTCSVCLERYTNPKTLPCLHSFCCDCLGRLPVDIQGDKHFVSCPICRQTTQLPDKGVSCFQSAFLVNSFLELHELLQKVSGSQQNSCENCLKEQATGYCKQCSKFLCQACINMHNGWVEFTSHQIMGVEDVAATASKLVPLKEQPTMECPSHSKHLEVYCDTCEQLICQLCTVTKQHRNHEFEPITDAFPRHQQRIMDSLQPVKQKLAAIAAFIQGLEAQERDILEQGQAMKKEIQATVQQLIQVLEESERELAKEVDRLVDAILAKISTHKKEADIAIAQLKSCEEFAEEELRIGSQQQILVMKRQMVERMEAICSQVKEDSLQPLEETNLRFVKSSSTLEACSHVGSVVNYSQLKAAITGNKMAITGHKASLDLTITGGPLPPELLSCQLSPAADPTVAIRCNVRQVTAGRLEVSYQPSTAGVHQLRVQMGGANILGTPFTVEVMPRQVGQAFKGLSLPCGVAINKDQLIVVESNKHCITIINTSNGKKILNFGSKGSGQVQFSYPFGVAFTQEGHIVVADQCNDRIQVLTVEGAFKAAVGSRGSQPLQFKYPVGVAAHPNGKIFVTEFCNNSVQVLNHDWSFSHSFGRYGQLPGEFDAPIGIAIDSHGMVYIADSGNSCVQKFTPEGNFVAIIGNKGEERDQLSRPYGVWVDSNDILHVTDTEKNTVSMFSTGGQFLGYVGNSDGTSFSNPQYITVDSSGRLFISHKDEVVTY